METLTLSAVVLAAGRSTRMGRDKALLSAPDMPATPLWQRQRDLLRAGGAHDVYLSARPDQAWTRAATGFAAVLHDAMPDCGPLVGITAALERAVEATHVAVLAIDLPAMRSEWFAALRETCAVDRGVVGRRAAQPDGRAFFEPLAAIYPRAAMWSAWEALTRGEYALQRWVAREVEAGRLAVRDIGLDETAWFENWNEGPPPAA